MARYSSLLGKTVEVVYRVGGIDLSACGELLADSGDFVVVHQHFELKGSVRAYQLKIPYECILCVNEKGADPTPVS